MKKDSLYIPDFIAAHLLDTTRSEVKRLADSNLIKMSNGKYEMNSIVKFKRKKELERLIASTRKGKSYE